MGELWPSKAQTRVHSKGRVSPRGKRTAKIENKIYLNGTNLIRIDAADEPTDFVPASCDAITDSRVGNLNADVACDRQRACAVRRPAGRNGNDGSRE